MANKGRESRGFLEVTDNGVGKGHVEAPPTPGRPIFSFSNGNLNFARKSFPSKWDDEEKWVASGSDSPVLQHCLLKPFGQSSKMLSRQCSGYKPQLGDIVAEKSRATKEKISTLDDVLLKDKFPNPKSVSSEPMQEGFQLKNCVEKSINDTAMVTTHEVEHRDIGTEMTPLGSSTTSRCPTPFKSPSPARHNTPANRSGPLDPTSPNSSNTIDMAQLKECHLAKLHLGSQFDSVASNWSSREEEEEDVSKSLRYFEMNDNECRKSFPEARSCAWEEEKSKSCFRHQSEEAKIQAWVNFQRAKAEAESRKLEVKIQKMRYNLEEKLMKRMADVHRKAEEWRAAAQFHHSEQIRKVEKQARKGQNGKTLIFLGISPVAIFLVISIISNNRHQQHQKWTICRTQNL